MGEVLKFPAKSKVGAPESAPRENECMSNSTAGDVIGQIKRGSAIWFASPDYMDLVDGIARDTLTKQWPDGADMLEGFLSRLQQEIRPIVEGTVVPIHDHQQLASVLRLTIDLRNLLLTRDIRTEGNVRARMEMVNS